MYYDVQQNEFTLGVPVDRSLDFKPDRQSGYFTMTVQQSKSLQRNTHFNRKMYYLNMIEYFMLNAIVDVRTMFYNLDTWNIVLSRQLMIDNISFIG